MIIKEDLKYIAFFAGLIYITFLIFFGLFDQPIFWANMIIPQILIFSIMITNFSVCMGNNSTNWTSIIGWTIVMTITYFVSMFTFPNLKVFQVFGIAIIFVAIFGKVMREILDI